MLALSKQTGCAIKKRPLPRTICCSPSYGTNGASSGEGVYESFGKDNFESEPHRIGSWRCGVALRAGQYRVARASADGRISAHDCGYHCGHECIRRGASTGVWVKVVNPIYRSWYSFRYTVAFRMMACTYSRVSVNGIDSTNSLASRNFPSASQFSTRSEPAL